jgi:hypothetical protein
VIKVNLLQSVRSVQQRLIVTMIAQNHLVMHLVSYVQSVLKI